MKRKVTHNFKGFEKQIKAYTKGVRDAVKDSIAEVNGPKEVQDSYDKSPLKVQSGVLHNSFTETNTNNSKLISTPTIYARIQDKGGVTGKGHKSIIKPTYYFSNAIPVIVNKIIEGIKKRISK